MPLTTYTSGEVLTAASLNANLSFAATNPVGGLSLISTTTIGSAVSSVTVSGAFSATYNNYKIILSGGVSSDASVAIDLTFGATVTSYYWARTGRTFANADLSGAAANTSAIRCGAGTQSALNMSAEVFDPFSTDQTVVAATNTIVSTTGACLNAQGYLDNTTSYTAFTLTPSSGTLTGGTIRVYGYLNS
jgi:hypothetical protein